MEIRISINGRNEAAVLEGGMDFLSRAATEKPQWKKDKTYNYYETELDIPEKDIMPVLEELTAKYPGLDLTAVYSYEIREEDRSAQWWGTTRITTKHHPDGTVTLQTDSSTGWA